LRRALIFAALMSAGALAFAAPALGGGNFSNNDFQGHIQKDPGTFMGFDLESGGSKVTHVTAAVKVQCTDGETGKILMKGKDSLNVGGNGSFSGKMGTKKLQNPGSDVPLSGGRLEVSGKVSNGQAKGKVGGSFDFLLQRARGVAQKVNCYSGLVSWKAKKGAHVTPVDQDQPRAFG
jgi:hypothetical protein